MECFFFSRHFQETQHTYAMQLGSNRVWDYAGDNYVHRLVQNKTDGKLVQVDEGGNFVQEEKLTSLTLEVIHRGIGLHTYVQMNQYFWHVCGSENPHTEPVICKREDAHIISTGTSYN